jgi:hypothetical protein
VLSCVSFKLCSSSLFFCYVPLCIFFCYLFCEVDRHRFGVETILLVQKGRRVLSTNRACLLLMSMTSFFLFFLFLCEIWYMSAPLSLMTSFLSFFFYPLRNLVLMQKYLRNIKEDTYFFFFFFFLCFDLKSNTGG